MAKILHLLRYAAYGIAALLGFLTYYVFQTPLTYLSPLSRTRICRRTFVLASHWAVGMPQMFCIVLVAILGVAFASWPKPIPIVTLCFLPLLIFLTLLVLNYNGEVLTVTNRGFGKWNVHLNVLRAKEQTTAARLEGALADLDSIAGMAREGGLKKLTLESPLLVHPATAQIIKRKLERAFEKHRFVANVTIETPRALGVVNTGFIHILSARQRQLKAHRIVHHAPLNLMTRLIEVELSPAPRSALVPEGAA